MQKKIIIVTQQNFLELFCNSFFNSYLLFNVFRTGLDNTLDCVNLFPANNVDSVSLWRQASPSIIIPPAFARA